MPYGTDALISLGLSIGAIALLLLAAAWLLRRSAPGAGARGARDCSIVRSLALGPRERLVVVQVGTKQLVVGVGSATLSLLCELTEPLPPTGQTGEAFADAFRRTMGRWRGG